MYDHLIVFYLHYKRHVQDQDDVKDGAYLYLSIFARLMTMREKHILARAIEIQKENWD